MPREKSTWRPPRGERTHAEHGDGPTRTSDEGRSCGRSKGVGPSGCLQRPTGNRRRPWRQRSRRLLGGSGVSREAPAPFCERPEVKLLRPTRHGWQDRWTYAVPVRRAWRINRKIEAHHLASSTFKSHNPVLIASRGELLTP